jgi:large repetitive protein
MTNKLPVVWNSRLRSIVVLLALTAMSYAQSAPRVTQDVDTNAVVRVPRSMHPLATAANDRGRIDSAQRLERMVLVLKPSSEQQAALSRLIDAQHNRNSASFHRWLTPAQFGAQFGVSDADLQKTTAWLEQNGFEVGTVARGKQWIEFSGSVAQVERAFHTEMHSFAVKDQKHVANASDISIPKALAPVVGGVLSLHDFRKQANHPAEVRVHRDTTTGKLVPDFTISNSRGTAHFLAPGDYRKIYNTDPLLEAGINGKGVSVAIVGRTNINLSDVRTFRKIFALPENDPVFIVNGTDPGINEDEVESDLDVEWSGAVAPNATIKFVTSSSTFTTDGVDLSIAYIIDNVVAPIMSASYSQCEAFLGTAGNEHFNSLFQQAAAEGITVFTSTGDNGPAACDFQINFGPAQNGANVSGLASTPFNVSVGGTQFREQDLDDRYWLATNHPDLSSAIGYIPEGVWNESCDPTVDPDFCFGTGAFLLSASSGGPSSCSTSTATETEITCVSGYPKPSWQAGVGVLNDGVRDLPDLSLAAGGHDGYLVCIAGSCQTAREGGKTVLNNASVIAGTSASTPSMAGIMAMLEQANGAFQGLANYSLYQLAAAEKRTGCNSSNFTDPTKTSTCVFYDVTAGNNSVPGQAGYKAVRGYDMSTGLGTVNAANLVAAWGAAHHMDSRTSLSAEATSVEHGQPISLNVAVTPASGTGSPFGDFSLVTGSGEGAFGGTLTAGKFSGPVSTLPGGFHSIKARYSGDAMFASSDSKDLWFHVTPEPSHVNTVAWTSVPDSGVRFPVDGPIGYGWRLGLQIDAKGLSGVGSPTGKATIMLDGTRNLGSVPLANGTAFTFVTADLRPGPHEFLVTYAGDQSFQSSQIRISVPVRKGVAPIEYIDTAPNVVTEGTPVLLLITVPGGGAEGPTGTVDIIDNGKKIAGPITLSNPGFLGLLGGKAAQATYRTILPVGFHELLARYSGDSNYLPDALRKPFGTVTVKPKTGRDARVTITQTPSKVTVGDSANYVVMVSPAKSGGALPTGTVNLVGQDGIEQSPAVPLIDGRASFTIPNFFGGASLYIGDYSGDSHYSPATSSAVITRVQAATPTVSLKAASSTVVAGEQISLSVAVIGKPWNKNLPVPRGLVVFTDSVNGGAARRLGAPQFLTTGNGGISVYTLPSVLPAGTNVIRARYLGSLSGDIPDSTPDWAPTDSNEVTVEVK